MKSLTFWFEFASTYSYLSAARIEEICTARGIELIWRPFLLGPIFAAQGWPGGPFVAQPVKGAYMWVDMERETARLGLPYTKPATFPQNSLLAARIATHLRDTPQIGGFVRGVYRANFAENAEIADPAVLSDILATLGLDPETCFNAAKDDATKTTLRTTTEEAQAAGIFGAPSFTVGDALFWGNDRLDAALDAAASG